MNIEEIITEKVQTEKQSMLLQLAAQARNEHDYKWQKRFMEMINKIDLEQLQTELR